MQEQKDKLSKFAQPAVILALTTAYIYIIGAFYLKGFYHYFGLGFVELNFTFDYILLNAMPGFAIILLLICPVIYYALFPTQDKAARNYFFLGAYTAAIISFIVLKEHIPIKPLYKYMGFISLLICVPILTYLTTKMYKEASTFFKIMVIITLLLVSVLMSYYSGEVNAGVIFSKKQNMVSIKLFTKKDFPIDINNKRMILITHKNGLFYVVEDNQLTSKPIQLFVIPEDQVVLAIQEKS